MTTSEIAVFITGQALITIRKDDLFDIAPVLDRWDASADLAGNGVGFLLYGLLDVSSTAITTPCRRSTIRVASSRTCVFDERRSRSPRSCGAAFGSVDRVVLRRVVLPMREVLTPCYAVTSTTVEGRCPVLPGHLDHVLRARSGRNLFASSHHDRRDQADRPGATG